MFRRISIRTLSISSSVLYTLIFFLLHQINFTEFIGIDGYERFYFPVLTFVYLLLSLTIIIGFKNYFKKLIPVTLWLSTLGFLFSIFYEYVFFTQSIVVRITSSFLVLFFVFILSYILHLVANILSLALEQNIPLSKVAIATSYLLALVGMYFGSIVLFSTVYNWLAIMGILFGITAFFSYSLIWQTNVETGKNLMISSQIGIVMIVFASIFLIWPVNVELIALSISLILYILWGMGLEIRQKINTIIWTEYYFIIFVIGFLFLLSASWGVNGPII